VPLVSLTTPPFVMLKFPLPASPTVALPVAVKLDPVPSTVTVPLDPGFCPISVVLSATVPPLETARVPEPSTPVAMVPAADRFPPLTAAFPFAFEYPTPVSRLATEELPVRVAVVPLLIIAVSLGAGVAFPTQLCSKGPS